MMTTNIFGFNFICNICYSQLADQIINDITFSKTGISNVITPNANFINVYYPYPELNKFCKKSKYILPDGQPMVWLSQLTKSKIERRMTGSDFFPVIFSKLKDNLEHCLFIVSNESLKKAFINEKNGASYIIPDFFEVTDQGKIDEISDAMAAEIIKRKINYIFIGISDPKQGMLAYHTSRKLIKLNYEEPCLFFFLGASFEFYFGLKKRAPLIFQNFGLEWFYRLIAEPKRMYKRYIFGNIVFIIRALKWFFNRNSFN